MPHFVTFSVSTLIITNLIPSVRYGASGAPKPGGPRPNFLPRPAERPGAGRVFLWFLAPAPGPTRSPAGSPLKQVGRNGPHPGNERAVPSDGSGVGVTPKITPAACCKGRAWRVKTLPTPPRNELYLSLITSINNSMKL